MVWHPSVHSFQNASSSSFLNRFWFWLFHKIGLGGGFKLLHRIVKFIIYGNLCKFMRNHKKCFFSFISRPILIVIALFGRAELRTLNFYTEFWNFAPLINYGNLCKFKKKKKIASSPSFLDRFSFCLFCVIGLGEGFKTCTQNFEFINYANLCKFTEPWKGPGGAIGFFYLFFFIFLLLLLFFFFFHVPSGASNLYFSHSNFFIFSPFPGHQILIFWPVENCTTWNLRFLMLRDAGWALRHWRSSLVIYYN